MSPSDKPEPLLPFWDDMSQPLVKVQRGWVRIPATLILSPIVLVLVVIVGAANGAYLWWTDWIVDCIKGK